MKPTKNTPVDAKLAGRYISGISDSLTKQTPVKCSFCAEEAKPGQEPLSAYLVPWDGVVRLELFSEGYTDGEIEERLKIVDNPKGGEVYLCANGHVTNPLRYKEKMQTPKQ
jgi:hypothetical protein